MNLPIYTAILPKRLPEITFCIVLLLSLSQCDTSDKTISRYNQHNAIWSESIYFRGFNPGTGEKLTVSRIRAFAELLRKSRIQYAYIFAGPFDSTGHLPAYAFSDTAVNSVKMLQDLDPELVVLPWIGGIQNKTVHLDDSNWVRNALLDTRRLIETLNVKGVHVDLECILPGFEFIDTAVRPASPIQLSQYGENVNSFHRKLRNLLPHSFISSVVTATSPGTRPWKRKTSMAELSSLVKEVDQLSFLYYDTGISDQAEFENNCDSLLRDIGRLKQISSHAQYLVAIGTFVNSIPELQKNRYLVVENVTNTLQTIRKVLAKKDYGNRLIDGISIFCDWQTDPEEWEEFGSNWSRL